MAAILVVQATRSQGAVCRRIVGGTRKSGGMEFDMDAAVGFIASRRWRYAATMPDWPHEYTVRAWRPNEAEEFVAFCQLIDRHGIVEPWPPSPAIPRHRNHYLVIGGHKYWAMGPRGDLDPPVEMTVINRADHPEAK